MLSPHPRYHHVRDTQRLTELARTPLRRTTGRVALQRPPQDAPLQTWREHARRLAAVTAIQPGHPLGSKALAPTVDETATARQAIANVIPGMTLGQQQHQSCTPRVFCAPAARGRLFGELHTFRFAKRDGV